jgi:MurNAc alpha-1-phosphate uridylyltransferase
MARQPDPGRAHLVLVPNPDHNPRGDFSLQGARVFNQGEPAYTFSGIGVYHPGFFSQCSAGKFSVVPLLRAAIDRHVITGELFQGTWGDTGTVERLESIRRIAAGTMAAG